MSWNFCASWLAANFMASPISHPKDPLHGITLQTIVEELVEKFGWQEMASRIPARCFEFNPSVKSSLTFLRKTPWARKRVEDWFIFVQEQRAAQAARVISQSATDASPSEE